MYGGITFVWRHNRTWRGVCIWRQNLYGNIICVRRRNMCMEKYERVIPELLLQFFIS